MGIEKLPDGTTKLRYAYRNEKGIATWKQKTIGTQNKREIARAWGELISSVEGSLTVRRLDEILAHYEQQKRCDSYTRALRGDLGRVRCDRKLQGVWDKYILQLRDRGLAQGTRNKYAATLKAALRLAERSDLIDSVPVRHWGIKAVPARDVVLSPEQTVRLLDVIDREAPHLSAIIRFAILVPCRTGELTKMQRSDLDLFGMRIRVRNSDMKSRVGVWKPIPPSMEDYFLNGLENSPWLFYRRDHRGRPKPLGTFKRAWGRARRIAGFPWLRFHDFRHMAATALVDAGTPEEVVNAVAGWKTSMLRCYYHRDPAKMRLVKWPVATHSNSVASGEGVANGSV